MRKRIIVLLPDGVGLRNFAFTSFVLIGEKLGWEVVFWNHTPFNLRELGYNEIKLQGKPRAWTDLLKRAKIEAELDQFTYRFNDPVYQTYKFAASNEGLKNKVKNFLVSYLVKSHKGEIGLEKLRKKMKNSERKDDYYRHCKAVLEEEKPDFIFCTNQRPVTAIAPLTAAGDLGIPTSTFIFSWDNLPKATMVVEPDHYFVWSEYMKQELLQYYSFIDPEAIHITGSPQFEPHFDQSLLKTRNVFYAENGLDPEIKYICFSGDDITTSPEDPQYLHDLAEAVSNLNQDGWNLGILFRRCPVDFSNRYDWVIEKYPHLIVPVEPKWKQAGKNWNEILPTREDLELQVNTIKHTEAVVNLASSMVFDYAVFDKPCMYLNYEILHRTNQEWSPEKVYNFVHFRSMPSKKAVIWINSKGEIKEKILIALQKGEAHVKHAKQWFKKIDSHPPEKASEMIWQEINKITTIENDEKE